MLRRKRVLPLVLLYATLSLSLMVSAQSKSRQADSSAVLDMLNSHALKFRSSRSSLPYCPTQPMNPFATTIRRTVAGFRPKEKLPTKYKFGWRAQCKDAWRQKISDRLYLKGLIDRSNRRITNLWLWRTNSRCDSAKSLHHEVMNTCRQPRPFRPATAPVSRVVYLSKGLSTSSDIMNACGPTEFYEDVDLMRTDGMLERLYSCPLVVLTASFGAQDLLFPPLGLEAESMLNTVCFVAFVDDASVKMWRLDDPRTPGVVPLHTEAGASADRKTTAYQVRHWSVVRWANGNSASPLLRDPRRLARLVKTLAHIIFPCALYTIWVDTKYQLRMHPLLLIDKYMSQSGNVLTEPKIQLVVGRHPQRAGILSEIRALKEKAQLRDTVNLTALDEQYATYSAEGVERDGPSGMSDTALLIRYASALVQRFGCAWYNELKVFDHTRDQPSFQYLLQKWFEVSDKNASVRMINRCEWTRSYIEHGHNIRHGISTRSKK